MTAMKPALFYAIRRDLYNNVVAVTSIKDHRNHWFGRYVRDNSATHGRGDLMGRFETREAAEAKREELAKIATDYDAKRKPHSDAISRLYREERDAIDEAVKGPLGKWTGGVTDV
jgi:hypothetical protein